MRGEEHREKDYDQQKCWHSEFDVNSCPAIPEAKLELKYKSATSTETMNSNSKPILTAKDKDNQKKFIISSFFTSYQKKVQDISDKLLTKVYSSLINRYTFKKQIQAKQPDLIPENVEEKKDNEPLLLSDIEINQLKKVAQALKSYYNTRSTESMFFMNVKTKITSEVEKPISGESNFAL